MEQGTEQWLQFRKGRIGSSDAPVIMGTSPYKSIYDLWLEKKDKKDPVEIDKFISEKGHCYEDLARLDLERVTGIYWVPEVFVHPDNDRIISSVDGYNDKEGRIWECKYIGVEKFNNFINEYLPMRDRISEMYYPQVIHHCYTTGARKIHFTVVVDHAVFKSIPKGEQVFKHVSFKLSEDDLHYMENVYKPKIMEFLELMDGEKFPIIESTDFIPVNDSRLDEMLYRYEGLNKRVSQFNEEMTELKEKIFDIAFQYNDKVLVGNAKISMSESKPKKFLDYELLIKENPGILKGVEVDDYRRHKLGRKTRRITFQKND